MTINQALDKCRAAAQKSDCLRRQYGAMLADNRLRGQYDAISCALPNKAPDCMPSSASIGFCARESAQAGTGYEVCRSVHAEQWALMDTADYEPDTVFLAGFCDGEEIENPMPCQLCRRMLLARGVFTLINNKGIHDLRNNYEYRGSNYERTIF